MARRHIQYLQHGFSADPCCTFERLWTYLAWVHAFYLIEIVWIAVVRALQACHNTQNKRKQVKYHVTVSPKQNQRCVVWFHHRVRHLWWRNHGECFHDTVWVLFSHLGNQECSHACTSASTKGMAQLKSLKAITTFGLLANDIKHGVDQLSSLSVVTFSPVVSCSSLAEDKVVWTEQLAKRSGTNTVHSSCSQDVAPRGILSWKQLDKHA